MAAEPDWRPAARVVDRRATTRKVLTDRECRVCGGPAATGHHVIPKSERGDDVVDNVVPLCGDGTRGCHGLVEARDGRARRLIGATFEPDEVRYVLGKLGDEAGRDYLRRHYFVDVAAVYTPDR